MLSIPKYTNIFIQYVGWFGCTEEISLRHHNSHFYVTEHTVMCTDVPGMLRTC
jgi:hypothetical protein